jgi:hypothetical protein
MVSIPVTWYKLRMYSMYRVMFCSRCGSPFFASPSSPYLPLPAVCYAWYYGVRMGTIRPGQSIGAPIFFGRCPSLSAHESESMLRTYLVFREKQERERERERETTKRHAGEAHSALTTAILLPQCLSCCKGKIVLLRMLTNLKLADLRLTTAQQRSTGQNLPSNLLGPMWFMSLPSPQKVENIVRWVTELLEEEFTS